MTQMNISCSLKIEISKIGLKIINIFCSFSFQKQFEHIMGGGDFCGYGYPSVFSNIQMVASIVQPIFSGPAATELLGLVNPVIVISKIIYIVNKYLQFKT